MKYLAVPEHTLKWLVNSPRYREAFIEAVPQLDEFRALRQAVYAHGPLRALASADGDILAFWNTDFLLNVGAEAWLFVMLHGKNNGLLDSEALYREVLDRILSIAFFRLQGLRVPDNYIHHVDHDGVHTCTSGGGPAFNARLAYVEQRVAASGEDVAARTLLVIGPAWETPAFRATAARAAPSLPRLAEAANGLLLARTRPVAEGHQVTALRSCLANLVETVADAEGLAADQVPLLGSSLDPAAVEQSWKWTYDEWLTPASPLTAEQRTLVNSDLVQQQPVRVRGAAGSGKTLAMLLMAIRLLKRSAERQERYRILYLAHNAPMADVVRRRIGELGGDSFLGKNPQELVVTTLYDFALQTCGIEDSLVFDRDAQTSRAFQLELVSDAFSELGTEVEPAVLSEMPLISKGLGDNSVRATLLELLVDEIGVAIKGHDLRGNVPGYVQAPGPLSRLHKALTERERRFVFDLFQLYDRRMISEWRLLDSDDLAIALLGVLRSPIWQLQRRDEGFDVVMVDEAQLYNENEKRVFALLTNAKSSHVSVVLALDEGQETRALPGKGLGVLGYDGLVDECFRSVHRSSPGILALAFHVIQRTTELFSPDFPGYGGAGSTRKAGGPSPLPEWVRCSSGESVGRRVLEEVRALRLKNTRRIGVACHAMTLWQEVVDSLRQPSARLPVQVVERRGETRGRPGEPVVAVGRPVDLGGQEFDAVICVALERGLTPPAVPGGPALAAALEQQSLREMYLAFTRARDELIVIVSRGGRLTEVLEEAVKVHLLRERPNGLN